MEGNGLPPLCSSVWDDQRMIHGLVQSMVIEEIPHTEVNSENINDDSWIKSFGSLELVDIVGDGSCQFRAVSQILYGTQEYSGDLRKRCAAYLGCNTIRFEDHLCEKFATFEDFCHAIGTTNEWGNHITLQALAELYNINIQVLSTLRGGSRFPLIQPRNSDSLLDTIYLAHFGEFHYGVIKPSLVDSEASSVTIKPSLGQVDGPSNPVTLEPTLAEVPSHPIPLTLGPGLGEVPSSPTPVKPRQRGTKRTKTFTSKKKSNKTKKKARKKSTRYFLLLYCLFLFLNKQSYSFTP